MNAALRPTVPLAIVLVIAVAAVACAPAAEPAQPPAAAVPAPETFVGVGLALEPLTPDGKGARVVGILPNSPAEAAGMAAGSTLVTVDGEDVRSLGLADLVARIRGPEGSSVTLEVLPAGAPQPIRYTLQRARVAVP